MRAAAASKRAAAAAAAAAEGNDAAADTATAAAVADADAAAAPPAPLRRPAPGVPLLSALPAAFSLAPPAAQARPLWSRLLEPVDLDAYLAWVHGCPHQGPALLFASAWAEAASTSPAWLVPAVWLPVAAVLGAPFALHSPDATPAALAGLAALGVAAWSLLEYALHRFVFHADERMPHVLGALLCHFAIHGCAEGGGAGVVGV